jgi:hypothetical protein
MHSSHLHALKKYIYGKHIVARVEKLIATGGKLACSACLYCTKFGMNDKLFYRVEEANNEVA